MNNSDIEKVRSYLKHKIMYNDDCEEFEQQQSQIFDLVLRTSQYGESNSALVIGPNESSKSKVMKSVLEKLSKVKDYSENTAFIKLNGLIHTDDRLALKSMALQLNLDNVLDGKVFGSYAENLSFLLACIKAGDKEKSKSIFLVIEEFELFCEHHNQTLLYNLFDISQSAQAPICVIGVTSRLDVIELFEKRIKSRFSHRQYFLFPSEECNTFTYKLEKINRILSISSDGKGIAKTFKTEWNKKIKSLTNDKKFQSLFQRLIDIDQTEKTLHNIFVVMISKLSSDCPNLTTAMFQEQLKKFEEDENVQILRDLSVLELCLIIAMKHHCDIYDNQPMNFEIILTRYMKFANSNSNMQTIQRPVVVKAFEHIQNLELISFVNIGGSKVQKEYQLFKLLVTSPQIDQAIKKTPGLPTEVVQWASSSFV